jgi:hypothetical protein
MSIGFNREKTSPPMPVYPDMPNRHVKPEDNFIPPEFLAEQIRRMADNLGRLSGLVEDKSLKFNEYNAQPLAGDSITSIQLQPDFEFTEVVEYIIITGPAAATFTVNLGKRTWQLTMPASGILTITPVKLYLSRSDQRALSTSTAGNWSLELAGYCDTKFVP